MNIKGLLISHRGVFNNENIPENSLAAFRRAKNLNISAEGSGVVIAQEYSKDELVPEGTVIKVTLKQTLTDAH